MLEMINLYEITYFSLFCNLKVASWTGCMPENIATLFYFANCEKLNAKHFKMGGGFVTSWETEILKT